MRVWRWVALGRPVCSLPRHSPPPSACAREDPSKPRDILVTSPWDMGYLFFKRQFSILITAGPPWGDGAGKRAAKGGKMAEQEIRLERQEGTKYRDNSDAWQTKVQESLRLPFPLPWAVIAGILFAVGILIEAFLGNAPDSATQAAKGKPQAGVEQPGEAKPPEAIKQLTANQQPPADKSAKKGKKQNSKESPPHPIIWLGIQCTLIAALANSVIIFEFLMDRIADSYPLLVDESSERAEQWIYRWYDKIFWSKRNLIAGLVLAAIITVSFGAIVADKFTVNMVESIKPLGIAYSYFITIISSFLAGSCFWTALSIAFMFFSMGREIQIKSSIFDSRTSILRMASTVLWKVSLVLSLIYFLGLISVYVCGIERDLTVQIIVAIFGAFIVAYFIIPQVNIHKHLLRLKQSRLGVLVEQIDQSFDRVAGDPSPENISQLRDLFHLQRVINGKSAWSFGLGELLALVSSILIPLIMFYLKSKN